MNAFAELRLAAIGWLDLIANRPGATEHFNASRVGLVNATGMYLAFVLLNLLVQSALAGTVSWEQLLLGLILNGLPLFGFWLVVAATSRLLSVPRLGLMVPGTYAMGFVLLIGLPLSLLGDMNFSYALLGALGYMLYRAGRVIGALSIGTSIAFALLSIVALVAMPIGLYMLTTQGQGTV